jgi:DNA topoisomerase-1
MPEAKPLVIVESPAKARTIAGFLGKGYVVESSIGHIRDLPRSAAEIPAAYRKQPWARLGVDVAHDFRPLYVVDPEKKAHIKKLKAALAQARELYLATDEDREGESIAWHLLEVLEPRVPVKRMVFHEITKKAIEHAIRHPRDIDRRLVDAQEARRILDRLYGYEVSPVLWKKIMPKLSAGRVQSVAIRMIVERERERVDFVVARYWDVEGIFAANRSNGSRLSANLVSVGDVRVAGSRDFGADGRLLKPDLLVLDQARAEELSSALTGGRFSVLGVERKPHRRSPSPPFMTSTLQQEAARKLRFSATRTMRAAQRLYESGFITYMRTDSTTLSSAAVGSAREQIRRMYGDEYLPDRPRVYATKVKNAQEAHEAIRPAGDVFRLPESVAGELGQDEARLYELIWMRTIASQMEDARGESVLVRIGGQASDRSVEFSARGYTITFPGFLRAYVEGSDDPALELEQRERPLPNLVEGQELIGQRFEPQGHETQPPARYTEASLVRRLEELGVGRPSTYATILSTILDRGYVWKKNTALVPSYTAFAVVALLEQYFGELVDYEFTARMEDELDAIANGAEQPVPWLSKFYFGDGATPNKKGTSPRDPAPAGKQGGGASRARSRGLHSLVADQLSLIDARAINTVPLGTDPEGREIAVRVGRYGAYLQRDQETVRLTSEIAPDELTIGRAVELFQAPGQDRELGMDPESGQPVLVRTGRFGAYVQLGAAGAGKEKPKTASLLSGMKAEELTLEQALPLLSLPRTLGIDPSDGERVTAQLGRYGGYVSKASESRSLERDEQVFTVTLPEALELLKRPRQRQAKAPSGPLRELGLDSVSGKTITLREGRFGPYVTDGETNASLRKGDAPESLTPERAQQLLAGRRDRNPTARRPKRKARAGAGSEEVVPAKSRRTHASGDRSNSGPAAKAKTAGASSHKKSRSSAKAAGSRAARVAGKVVPPGQVLPPVRRPTPVPPPVGG